jgi:hypothetical protein
MSENSLRIRGKFINKLLSKLEDLNDDFELLSKVDKKISKKINKQRGGATLDVKELQLQTLKKKLALKKQQDDLDDASAKIAALNAQIDPITATLKSMAEDISGFELKISEEFSNAPTIAVLTPEEVAFLTATKTTTPDLSWGDFQAAVKGDAKVKDTLLTKITDRDFDIFMH